ncbi:Gfo/Idh/MocA family oxidoreductase [Candidatus Poribacteria bacterium]|jgi:scyllo-inositol 2-dehydrogenase (NADP+)|nr:Gfo/Idh/MocA family oxidoreductase [Candidatus Poribacteria bacterium]MBT5712418.1 Gfo/Idh/MocA family oxidoreductase [Candidatus Poribacteria bacterium]MBT7099955.1 Gfo/Idh/MocA family oxidoreductase [Candidatus Poribacteria bacterium]MBT7807738.1 Gfo/Idh/MocA family oxidoreductase [Candidatus Poribacteria bacterium]
MRQVGVAIVGLGNSGWRLHGEYLAGAARFRLAGVCDADGSRLTRVADALGAPQVASFKALLRHYDVDLVVLAVPHTLHVGMTVEALEAGKHVVVEKPMCLDVGEADRMIDAAGRAGRLLTVFHNRRWDADFLTLRRALEGGVLGDVRVIESRRSGGFYLAMDTPPEGSWTLGLEHAGGAVYSRGPHVLDQLLCLTRDVLGVRPTRVFCHTQTVIWPDDVFRATIEFDGGLVAQVEVNIVDGDAGPPRWHALGSKGIYLCATPSSQAVVTELVDGRAGGQSILDTVSADAQELFYDNVHAALTDGEVPLVTLEHAREVVALTDRLRASAASGNVVECVG